MRSTHDLERPSAGGHLRRPSTSTYNYFNKQVLLPPVEPAQYMSREYRELCESLGVVQSVGRTGSCWDNAVSESFWATMKREMISRFRFATRAEARRVITRWITHYNALPQHSSINYMSPIEWELQFAQRLDQAA